MKLMKSGVAALGISLFLVAGTALAAGWSEQVTISDIDIEAVSTTTTVWLSFVTAPATNKPTCTPSTSTQLELVGSADSIKAMTSAASAAFLAGRPVQVLFDGGCNGTHPRVSGVRVY